MLLTPAALPIATLSVLASSLASSASAQAGCSSQASVETLGLATPGVRGLLALEMAGAPVVGGPFHLRVTSGPPSAHGCVVFSPNETPVFFPEFRATGYPGLPLIAIAFTMDAEGSSPPILFHDAVPVELCGVSLVAQGVAIDPAATGGVSFSKAARFGVGEKTGGPVLPGQRHDTGLHNPRGLAITDLDGDLVPDLLSSNFFGPVLSSLLGKGDGTFAAPLTFGSKGLWADSVTTGDWNADGRADAAAILSDNDRIGVYLGQGDGTFGPEVTMLAGHFPSGIASGDLDGNGTQDLVSGSNAWDSVFIDLGAGAGTFSGGGEYPAGDGPHDVAIGDFNGDRVPDVVTANEHSDDLTVLLGLGAATLAAPQTLPTGDYAISVAVGDVDANGTLDLVAGASASDDVSVYLGAGDGTFSAAATVVLKQVGDVALADLDDDSHLDLVVAGDGLSLFYGFGDGSFEPGASFPAGKGQYEVQVADLDGNSTQDIAVTDAFGQGVITFLGRGRRELAIPHSYPLLGFSDHPNGITTGDFNGDQVEDLAMGSFLQDLVAILLGRGDGTFEDPIYQSGAYDPFALAAGDLNGDGKVDLVVATWTPGGFRVLLGNGDGTFGSPLVYVTGTANIDIQLADLNDDNHLDVILSEFFTSRIAVALGVGDGTMQPTMSFDSGFVSRKGTTADLNGDGFLDVVVANDGITFDIPSPAGVSVHLGQGDGTFAPVQVLDLGLPDYTNGSAAKVGDLDGDGILDLAVVVAADGSGPVYHDQVVVRLGKGNAVFAAPTSYPIGNGGADLQIADFDGDRLLDLAALCNASEDVWLLPGKGDGSFDEGRIFPIGAGYLAQGDWDGDLIPDLAAATQEKSVTVLPNQLLR